MRWTNTANLPQPLVSAITNDLYDSVGDISVTGLIMPPKILQLMKRHDDEIVEDASEGIWRLIGSIGHKILERADTDNHLAEERLTANMHGWTISGKADLLNPQMRMDDYKFVSVYAMKGLKPEFEQQINSYAWLYRENHFDVAEGYITAILRDWSKLKAKREPDTYPPVGVVVKQVPLWIPEQQWDFVSERVLRHQMAESIKNEDLLPDCTPEERWQRPAIWAVKKKGGKRAIPGGLHTSLENAEGRLDNLTAGKFEIEFRPGESVRCESYCPVLQWCHQGQLLTERKGIKPNDQRGCEA